VSQVKPKHPGAKKRRKFLNRRDVLILLTLWAVGCVIVTVLLGLFYANSVAEVGEQPRPVATFTIPFEEENTAKTAYLAALNQAQSWQSDVEIVALSSRWPQADIQNLGRAEVWDFRFYSAERNRIYFAIVTPGQEEVAGRAHLYKLKSSVNLIDPANWVIDSDEAISIWANNGGGLFLENFPGSSVELLLRQAPDIEKPVWDIIGLGADQTEIFYLTIDATNGEVLN